MIVTAGRMYANATRKRTGHARELAVRRVVRHPRVRIATNGAPTLTRELAAQSSPMVSAIARRSEFRTERLPERRASSLAGQEQDSRQDTGDRCCQRVLDEPWCLDTEPKRAINGN